jgi:hypothetical protein
MRTLTSALLCATGFWLAAPETALGQPSCISAPPSTFDVRENPFNLSAEERDAIIDVVHAFALTWDLRDAANLPLLFIDDFDDGPEDGLRFTVCTSTPGVGGTGTQIILALSRTQIERYFGQVDPPGPFRYVEDNALQARHLISNIVVKSHRYGDAKVLADLLVTLQDYDPEGEEPPLEVDYTGMIEAVLTKEWGGVWKFRELTIYMDVPYPGEGASFRGR